MAKTKRDFIYPHRMGGQLPPVRSDGRTAEQLISSLEEKGYSIGNAARQILLSDKFRSTRNKSYKGIWISRTAHVEDWVPTTIELAALLRESVDDSMLELIGVQVLLVFHQPVTLKDGFPYILGLTRDGGGRRLVGFPHGPHGPKGSVAGMPASYAYAHIMG